MNFTSLEQRRLLGRPRELASHRRDPPEVAEADENGGERGGRADERMILASTARLNGVDTDRLYHADGEALPLDREPQRTLKRRMDGAAPQLDQFERGSERAERGSAPPPSDPRRRGSASGFDRASDRPERGSVLDPRHFESNSDLAFERPLARPERSFSGAGLERDEERERTRVADENAALEQFKEKDLSDEAIQEIVIQYKTALTELTVNSKIIITKLTIFAGDNIHAAKGIAATICSHILEVPSDQKLPSLYLLDSIVKNIGRDYVDLFAARLPEVFCEAYRQVDPSLHPKMKRLFETWREVFFGDPLLVIEAQLQFSSINSNLAAADLTIAKPAQSPPQRPGHGIHVNPSYLEAQRQRLQQSSRPPTAETARDGFNAEAGTNKGYSDNFLDYDYVCTDIGAKVGSEIPRTQEAWGKTWPKEDGSLFRSTDSELNQQRYPRGSALDGRHPSSTSARLLIDAYGNIRVPPILKSPPVVVQPHSKGGGNIQKSWEDEGHSWDDKTVRPADTDRRWEVLRKDGWFPGEGGKDVPDIGGAVDKGDIRSHSAIHNPDALLALPDRSNHTFQREYDENGLGPVPIPERETPTFGLNTGSIQGHQFPADQPHHTSPQHASPMMQINLQPFSYMPHNQLPPPQLPPALGSLTSAFPGNGSSFGFTPLLPRPLTHPQSLLPPQASGSLPSLSLSSVFPSNTLGHGGIPTTNRTQLTEQPVLTHPSLPHPVVQMPLPQPTSSFQASHTQALQAGNSLLSQPFLFERSSSALPVLPLPTELLQSLKQLQEHLPGFKSMPDNIGSVSQTEQIGVIQQHQQHRQQWSQQVVIPPAADPQHLGQTLKADGAQTGSQNHNAGHLLAGVFGSAIVSPSSAQVVSGTSFAALPFRDSAHFSIPSVSSGQPQPLFAGVQGNSSSVVAAVHIGRSSQVLQPPLPPGPPPKSSQVSSLPSQPLTSITSLLSSLVAQGVISAANSAAPFPQPHIDPPTSLLTTTQNIDASYIASRISSDDSSALVVASTFSSQKLTSSVINAPSTGTTHMPLGVEFKPELLRKRHDFVINVLYGNPLYQCKTCGLRCKSQDDLTKHMEQHATKSNGQNQLGKLSRSWFTNKDEWVKGADASISHLSALPEFSVDQSFSKIEDNDEPTVPADEDQAACTLCGEPFEDFYDDEADLWMYKGAVYLNRLSGMASKDKGPIVHAKCRSTSDVPEMNIMEAGHEAEQAKKRVRYSG